MKRTLRTACLSLGIIAFSMILGAGTAHACPNCKEAVSLGESETASMSSGYNWSVMFMLAVPFSMMGTGAIVIRRAVKRGAFPEL